MFLKKFIWIKVNEGKVHVFNLPYVIKHEIEFF